MNSISFQADTTWEERFNEYLRNYNLALDSLRSLVDEGIPQPWLLEILHAYADPSLRQSEQCGREASL